jgi:hypothetical protein
MRAVEPGDIGTFHDQVGYLLWEPATSTVTMTLAIPRAQVAMASGTVAPDATKLTLRAVAGDPHYGICTAPFLDAAFHTPSWQCADAGGCADAESARGR